MKYINHSKLRALRHSSPETELIYVKMGCNNWHIRGILSPLSPSQDTNIHLTLNGIRGHFCDGECSDATTVAFRINSHFSKAGKHNLRSNAKKQFPLMTKTPRYVTVQCKTSERTVQHTWIWNSSYCAAPALQWAPLCCQLMYHHQAYYTTITAIICWSI